MACAYLFTTRLLAVTKMKLIDTALDDVKIVEPNVFGDDRGFFLETWSDAAFSKARA